MEIDKLTAKERYDALAEIADLFYNKGLTQIEIANRFDTTRFRIAKLLQDARAEQIVEIKVNFSNKRNKIMENELTSSFPIKKALVIDTQNSPYLDNLREIGEVAAQYLSELISESSVVGLSWGRSIYTAVSQLPQNTHNSVSAVQLAGYLPNRNPSADSRSLVQQLSSACFGTPYFLNTPMYINDPELKSRLLQEPDIKATLDIGKNMDICITGIGAGSSLAIHNPEFRMYVTKRDLNDADHCIGSIYGYILDEDGDIADIDLNKKLVSVGLDSILSARHKIAIAYGRHKIEAIEKIMKKKYIDTLITDSDTANGLLS